MQTELNLSRENLVGLAILLGCDYISKVRIINQKRISLQEKVYMNVHLCGFFFVGHSRCWERAGAEVNTGTERRFAVAKVGNLLINPFLVVQ